MAKATFDIKTEATRGLYAGAGAADLALAAVKEYLAEVQKRLEGVQKDVTGRVDEVQKTVTSITPKTLRDQALTVVGTRVESVSEDAKARRAAVEARVAELQADAKALPTRVQTIVDDNVATATKTYTELAKRGETLGRNLRNQPEVQQVVAQASTTVSKAKTTRTQATKAAADTTATAKKAATATKKSAAKKAAPVKSSAKATGTSAVKTATAAAKAAEVTAEKAGDTSAS